MHSKANVGEHTITAGSTSVMFINLQPELLNGFIPDWQQYAHRLYEKNSYDNLYVSNALPIRHDSRMQQILLAMYDGTFSGVTRSLYIEAKAMELMALQLEELVLQPGKATSPVFTICKADHEKLEAMYEYLADNYLEPLSLASLAKRFTLNEFKLKKGFKQLYGQSAFNYIQTLRMGHAHKMLEAGIMTVNEVSDLTRYSSIHNFSNAFYKMYHYRPSMIRPAGMSYA